MNGLPVLVSVPHGGLKVPDWLADNCLLSPAEIAADGDLGAREIYSGLGDQTRRFITTPIARAVLDMNRPETDRSKDGVVKTHTCWDVPIWRVPTTPEQVERLLAEHHRPYHAALSSYAEEPGIRLGIDCHTMASTGPPIAPDPGAARPAACLSNADGTCPQAWIEVLAEALTEELGGEVRHNDPFRGGHTTRTHGVELPWLQLELSRAPTRTHAEKAAAVSAALRRLCRSL